MGKILQIGVPCEPPDLCAISRSQSFQPLKWNMLFSLYEEPWGKIGKIELIPVYKNHPKDNEATTELCKWSASSNSDEFISRSRD